MPLGQEGGEDMVCHKGRRREVRTWYMYVIRAGGR